MRDDLELLVQARGDVLSRPVSSPLITVRVGHEHEPDSAPQCCAIVTRVEPWSDEATVERRRHPLPVGHVGLCLVVLLDVPGDDEGSKLAPELDQALLLLPNSLDQIGRMLLESGPADLKRLESNGLFGHDDSSLQVRRSVQRSSVVLGLIFYNKESCIKKA